MCMNRQRGRRTNQSETSCLWDVVRWQFHFEYGVHREKLNAARCKEVVDFILCWPSIEIGVIYAGDIYVF